MGATYRDEEVGHSSLILQPALTVLLAAAGDVPNGAVRNHAAEEEGVEPGEGTPILIISFAPQFKIREPGMTYWKPVIRPQEMANQASAV